MLYDYSQLGLLYNLYFIFASVTFFPLRAISHESVLHSADKLLEIARDVRTTSSAKACSQQDTLTTIC